ncbi:MAG: nitroreductase family protein, partial [Muribaculaceae bacterium]|nr:nitroreductase family protein [Muribaculaceae bacterium]
MRNYAGTPLEPEQLEKLRLACREASAPLPGKFLISMVRYERGGEFRPGTYGVLRGARDFFVLASDGSRESTMAGAFALERLVLEATDMNLGTCWMGATFSDKAFAREADVPEGMRIVAVSPVGVGAGHHHLIESIMRMGISESNRKPFSKLFYRGNFNTPLAEGHGPYARALEAVRRGPSAKNAQPWRVLLDSDGQRVHFCTVARDRYTDLDMGIALCNFSVVAPKGRFER